MIEISILDMFGGIFVWDRTGGSLSDGGKILFPKCIPWVQISDRTLLNSHHPKDSKEYMQERACRKGNPREYKLETGMIEKSMKVPPESKIQVGTTWSRNLTPRPVGGE